MFLGIIFGGLGYPVNVLYDSTVFIPVFIILGFEIFFYGLIVIPRSIALKEKRFKIVSVIEIVTGIIYGVVSIALGLLGFNYYSIIIGRVIRVLFTFVFYYIYSDLNYKVKLQKKQ